MAGFRGEKSLKKLKEDFKGKRDSPSTKAT
jgi:hypothetical protein